MFSKFFGGGSKDEPEEVSSNAMSAPMADTSMPAIATQPTDEAMEPWVQYFDLMATPPTAHTRRWAMKVFHDSTFPNVVDQAFAKFSNAFAAGTEVPWSSFPHILAEVVASLPTLIPGMRGAAANLASVEIKDLRRFAERFMNAEAPLDVVAFTSLFKFIVARLIVASIVCGSIPPFEGADPIKLELVRTQVADVLRGRLVRFEPKKDDIIPDAASILDSVGLVLEAHPEVRMRVEAHADSAGQPNTERLDRLSQRRAKACVDYLIAHGVATRRLVAKGWGARHPLPTGDSKRVEFNPF